MTLTSGQASCDEGDMVALVTHAITQEVPQLVVAGEVYDSGWNSHYSVDKQRTWPSVSVINSLHSQNTWRINLSVYMCGYWTLQRIKLVGSIVKTLRTLSTLALTMLHNRKITYPPLLPQCTHSVGGRPLHRDLSPSCRVIFTKASYGKRCSKKNVFYTRVLKVSAANPWVPWRSSRGAAKYSEFSFIPKFHIHLHV